MSETKTEDHRLSDADKIALAMWALVGGTYWLGRSVKRGPAEYCVVKATSPYGGTDVLETSYHIDPWQSLLAGYVEATGELWQSK